MSVPAVRRTDTVPAKLPLTPPAELAQFLPDMWKRDDAAAFGSEAQAREEVPPRRVVPAHQKPAPCGPRNGHVRLPLASYVYSVAPSAVSWPHGSKSQYVFSRVDRVGEGRHAASRIIIPAAAAEDGRVGLRVSQARQRLASS